MNQGSLRLTMCPEPGFAIIRRSSGCIYHTEAESRAWPAARSIKEGPSSTHFNGWEGSYFSISIFPLCQYVKADWSADAINLIMSGTGQQQGGVNVHKWENLEKIMVKNQECYWQVYRIDRILLSLCRNVMSSASCSGNFRLFFPHTKEYIKAQFSKI